MREKKQGLQKDQGCKDRPKVEAEENQTKKRLKSAKRELGLRRKLRRDPFCERGEEH